MTTIFLDLANLARIQIFYINDVIKIIIINKYKSFLTIFFLDIITKS